MEDQSPARADAIAEVGPSRTSSPHSVTSPDGRRIATKVPTETVVHIKDAATNRVLTTLRGHTDGVECMVFSPDNKHKRIATTSRDQSIKIWDAEDGREVLTLRGHTHIAGSLAFSRDGHLIASGSIDTTVRVWDATPFPPDELRDQEARWLVPAAQQWQSKDELIDWLRLDKTHSAPVRAAALAIVEKLEDDPDVLESMSWAYVRFSDKSRDEYLRALPRAEAAVRLAPQNGTYLQTLGAALYRVGRYAQALEALRRAAELDTAKLGRPTPGEIAFVAMTHHRLGHAAEARAGLDVLRARMRAPEATENWESQSILQEVEALIEPGSVRKKP